LFRLRNRRLANFFRQLQGLRCLDAANYRRLYGLLTGENCKRSFAQSVLLGFDFYESLRMVDVVFDGYFVDIVFQALRHLIQFPFDPLGRIPYT